ncbi:retron St85 family effector protein [Simplicispira hankyongi]|uniref:retron St85 family effector protein n=1 Tax=Simplicispira hankyongi TaxID=2315688 RepID=UPI0011C3F78B|nr:retron St85 family effector protein [Simplicispira hankyongi]
MLIRALKHSNSAIGARVRNFGLAIKASPPLLARTNQLLFLCGANRSTGLPSARREAVKKFIEGLSPDFRVIYAEGVFGELSKIEHSRNVLDLEHEISDIADKILIVLESPSAFCELGAFSHQSFRKKLVIVNDLEFKAQSSFINTGPIAAAEEVKAPVLWYPMKTDGIHTVDGIGAIFNDLKKSITVTSSSRGIRISGDISLLAANKSSLYFVHDLVLFAGPLSHEELVEFLIIAFGRKSYDILKRLLGVLRAAELIRSFDASGTWVYESVIGSPFLRYEANINSLMASIRIFHLQTQSSRFER